MENSCIIIILLHTLFLMICIKGAQRVTSQRQLVSFSLGYHSRITCLSFLHITSHGDRKANKFPSNREVRTELPQSIYHQIWQRKVHLNIIGTSKNRFFSLQFSTPKFCHLMEQYSKLNVLTQNIFLTLLSFTDAKFYILTWVRYLE